MKRVFILLSILVNIAIIFSYTSINAQEKSINSKSGLYNNFSIHSVGGSSYASVADPSGDSPLDLTTEGSIEAWVKISSYHDYAGIALKPVGNIDSYTLQMGGSGGYGSSKQVLFGLNDGSNKKVISVQNLDLDRWYHLVGCWSSDGDSLVIYINGKKDITNFQNIGTVVTNNSPLIIGKGNYGNLDGYINCVRVWDKALKLEDVQRVMYETEIPATHYLYSNLMGSWKFDEGSGTIIPDGSSYHNDATITNTGMWQAGGAPLGAIWQGENHSWNDEINWPENLVPNENIKVIAPASDNNIQITDFAAARELTALDNSEIRVKSTSTKTGSLFVKESSSGDIFVERFIPANYYHYICKPVDDNRSIANITTTSNDNYMGLDDAIDFNSLFYWDESYETNNSGGIWIDMLRNSSTSSLITGKGYAYSDRVNISGGGNDNTVLFQGEIETGDVNIECQYSSQAGKGFHLVGNPFSSTIAITDNASASNFIEDNSAILNDNYEAIFVWKEDKHEAVWNDNYAVICNSGFVGTATNCDFIQLGQSFMIKVDDLGGDITFKSDIQVDPEENSNPFFKKEEKSWPGVELSIVSEFAESKTSIGFNNKMTIGLDPSYDVKSLKSNKAINLYSLLATDSDGDYAVQSVPQSLTSISCGVEVIESGEYSFSAYQKDLTELYIEDKELNTITNLLDQNSETIFLNEGVYNDRFTLHFKTASNSINSTATDENFTVYGNSGNIYFKNISGTAQIFDISGRLIKSVEVNSDFQRVEMKNHHGMFLVKTANGDKKVVL